MVKEFLWKHIVKENVERVISCETVGNIGAVDVVE